MNVAVDQSRKKRVLGLAVHFDRGVQLRNVGCWANCFDPAIFYQDIPLINGVLAGEDASIAYNEGSHVRNMAGGPRSPACRRTGLLSICTNLFGLSGFRERAEGPTSCNVMIGG